MFISNYLNAAIGETFFIFGQLLRTFYPVFEQLFKHSLEQSIYPTLATQNIYWSLLHFLSHMGNAHFFVIFIDRWFT